MDLNVFLQHFDYLMRDIDGIKKIRRLIINLAVSGLLDCSSKDGWVTKKLGQLVTFEYGKSLPEKSRISGEFPVYGSNGIVGSHCMAIVHQPAIVIGRKGSAGALNISNKPFWPTDVTYYSVPPDFLDIHFYFYILSTLNLDKLGKGIKPGLNRNDAYEIQISYPPIEVQAKIVSKINKLLALCEQLEKQLIYSQRIHSHLMDSIVFSIKNVNVDNIHE